jgi:hypothetical protein
MSEIAERVSAIVSAQYGTEIDRAAAELGVLEVDLGRVLRRGTPPLGVSALAELLARVVQKFGVDPGWLVTGRYDVRSHLIAEEHRADLGQLRDQIRGLLRGPENVVAIEPVARADMRPEITNRAAARTRRPQPGEEREQ